MRRIFPSDNDADHKKLFGVAISEDGYKTIARIKQDHKYEQVPVIIYSTSRALSDINAMYKAGAEYYIIKPDNYTAIKGILKKICAIDLGSEYKRPGKDDFVWQLKKQINMIRKGTIKEFSVAPSGLHVMQVKLSIKLDNDPSPLEIMMEGTQKDLCTKLNAIPFKGQLVAPELKESRCLVYDDRGKYHFVSILEKSVAQ